MPHGGPTDNSGEIISQMGSLTNLPEENPTKDWLILFCTMGNNHICDTEICVRDTRFPNPCFRPDQHPGCILQRWSKYSSTFILSSASRKYQETMGSGFYKA